MALFEVLKQSRIKWVLGVIGAIIVSMLGSALWDLVKPYFGDVTNSLLSIISLGIESYKDDTYLLIAAGFHEHSSLELYFLIITGIPFAYIVFSFGAQGSIRLLLNKHKLSILREFPELKEAIKDKPDDDDLPTAEGTLKFYSKIRKLIKIYYWVLWGFALILLVSNILIGIRSNYINKAITNYYQLRHITDVFTSVQTRLDYDKKFALIKNDRDYKLLYKDLLNVARNNDINPPPF